MIGLLRRVALGVALMSLSVGAQAAAVLQALTGDVRVTIGGHKPAAAKQDQRVPTGSRVLTGTDGLAVLKFDDEQTVAVSPNSEFVIVDYNYEPRVAAADRSELSLHRGAVRVVSGLLARRNVEMFVLRTPHVNLSVRGTDFSATIIGESFWAVNDGAVAASTNVGTGVYGKGSYGRAQALDRLASGVSRAGLPVAVLGLFNELNSPRMTAHLGSARGGQSVPPVLPAADVGAQGGIGMGSGLAVIAGLLAALAAAGAGGSDGGVTPPTSH
jgi:hypothetical protein